MAIRKETPELTFKKKKWFNLVTPQAFDSQIVGETMANEAQNVVGRTVRANLMYLTKNPKKQNFNIIFKVTSVGEGKANLKTFSFEMLPASIKRLVRAGRDRLDESFIIKSKDGVYARVKPLLITKAHQSSSIGTRLRRMTISFIRKYAQELDFEPFMRDIVDGKLQKLLRDKLAPVSQLRNCEVRAIDVIENFTALKQKKLDKLQVVEEEVKVQEEVVEEVEQDVQA